MNITQLLIIISLFFTKPFASNNATELYPFNDSVNPYNRF